MAWSGKRTQADFDEEIRSHIELEADRLQAEGMSAEDALDAARRRFGNQTIAQERFYHASRAMWLESFAGDVKYAWRQLARSPVSSAVIVLTLALGIGANAVIFGVVDRLLVRPPAHVVEPERVTRIYYRTRVPDWVGGGGMSTSPVGNFPMITALQREVPSLESVAGVAMGTLSHTLGSGVEAVEVKSSAVTGNYFELLGVRPSLGRFFAPDEGTPEAGSAVVVLSDGFWRRHFGADPGVIGTDIRLDNRPFTVIGVAPKGFTGINLQKVDLWAPVSAVAPSRYGKEWATQPRSFWIAAIGRMKSGATTEAVNAEATLVYRRAVRDDAGGWSDTLGTMMAGPIVAAQGPEEQSAEAKVSVWLAGVSLVVLLVACANVANLLLGRAVRRRREIAVRLAMGVGRGRLVRQLLTETLLLALLGAVAALLLAWWGGYAVRSLLLPEVTWGASPVDTRVLAFTAVVTFATVLLAGLLPAVQASGTDVATALKTGGRDGGGRRSPLRNALLVAQAALSVMLLVGAGLFVKSLGRVHDTDVGIDLSRVLLVQMNLRTAGFEPAEVRRIWREAAERANHLPGVEHTALVGGSIPLQMGSGMSMKIPGRDSLPDLPNGGPYGGFVGADYFRTLGAKITRGRDISETDERVGARVMLVNETVATHYWPGASPVGECVRLGSDSACTEVIGVVQDVMLFRMVDEVRGQVYVPLTHPGMSRPPGALFVRAGDDPVSTAELIRRELQALSPNMPFVNVASFETLVAPQLQSWRLGATMFAIFGGLALVIAAIGLYSVLAYAVSQRVPEIGVRMALGATRANIVRLFVRGALGLAGAGLLLGLVLSLAAAPWISELLYETSPRDPGVMTIVTVVLLVVAAVASIAPALRAARVDPSVALRSD